MFSKAKIEDRMIAYQQMELVLTELRFLRVLGSNDGARLFQSLHTEFGGCLACLWNYATEEDRKKLILVIQVGLEEVLGE